MTPLIIFKENFNFITAGIKYKDNTIDLIGILTTQLGNVSFSEIWSPIHNYMILQYDIILDYKTNCHLTYTYTFFFFWQTLLIWDGHILSLGIFHCHCEFLHIVTVLYSVYVLLSCQSVQAYLFIFRYLS